MNRKFTRDLKPYTKSILVDDNSFRLFYLYEKKPVIRITRITEKQKFSCLTEIEILDLYKVLEEMEKEANIEIQELIRNVNSVIEKEQLNVGNPEQKDVS